MAAKKRAKASGKKLKKTAVSKVKNLTQVGLGMRKSTGGDATGLLP